MTTSRFLGAFSLMSVLLFGSVASAQMTTTAATPEELEAIYTQAIENRAKDIINDLSLGEAANTAAVHNAIISFYRALRARDAVADAYLESQGKDTAFDNQERMRLIKPVTSQLHSLFQSTLAAYLTPEQIEIVKDKMTYNKVNVTYDAYCEIIPSLTDNEKAMILAKLKAARDKAIDGGSADEKHAIFEIYKEQINSQLTSNGHDVEKAFKEWEAKKSVAQSPDNSAGGDTN